MRPTEKPLPTKEESAQILRNVKSLILRTWPQRNAKDRDKTVRALNLMDKCITMIQEDAV